MVCVNGTVTWSINGLPVNAFGAPNMTLANCWDGVLPLLEAVTSHGGAVQAVQASHSPVLYATGTTYGGVANTTVAAINALGYLIIDATSAFSATGGSGVIVCSDGVHPFTYTGLTAGTSLNGVVIASEAASNANGNVNQSSSATVYYTPAASPIYPASLQSGNGGVEPNTGYVNDTNWGEEAWPLHWSSTAYSTLTAALPGGGGMNPTYVTSAGWADAQAVNANGNLNSMLDGIAVLAAALSPYPLILRPMPESNNGSTAAFWYDQGQLISGSTQWGAQLFRYIVGYLTGNAGFTGQPVTAVPVHNILFATNSAASGTETIGIDYPTVANVGFVADLAGMDVYSSTWNSSNPKAVFTTAQGVTGYSNVPPLLMEAYGNTALHYDPSVAFNGASGETGAVDLAGLTTLVSGTTYATVRQFAASGSLQVMTSTGVRTVAYTSFSHTGTSPSEQVTFSGVTTTGVPTGSIINQSAEIFSVFSPGAIVGTSSATPNTGCANFLTGIKDATAVGGCHFCINPLNYGGTSEPNSMLFQPGFAAIMQDPATVNLPTPGNWSGFGWGAGQGTEWSWQSPLVGTT